MISWLGGDTKEASNKGKMNFKDVCDSLGLCYAQPTIW
jgi:hypothetical protein